MMSTRKLAAIGSAQLEWRNDSPFSCQYGDVYFSKQDGLAESKHVFIQGNRLAERWKNKPAQFLLAETGFGSGLNFFAACKRWLSLAGTDSVMYYYAVEKHPLEVVDSERILSAYPQFNGLVETFFSNYPPLVSGIHRLNLFAGRVHLRLAFMDVEEWLQSLNIRADAWFLDGFSPARNPKMWSNEVLQGVACNTRVGGSFATFTVAGVVRRGLEAAGFEVEKMPGFGQKREVLRGSLQRPPKRA